jgi:regulator of sigma E protease
MMTAILSLLSFVLLFVIVASIHELGHFFAAIISGIRVLEFSIGFGPKLYGKKLGKTQFSARGIPLGGYVRIAGMLPEEEGGDEPYPQSESYQAKPVYSKLLVITSGALANILATFILLSIIFMSFGMPVISNEIEGILPGSPAEQLGLKAGDKIIKVDGIDVHDEKSMLNAVELIHKSAKEKLSMSILHNGDIRKLSVSPQYDPKLKAGRVGFTLKVTQEKKGVFASIIEGGRSTLLLVQNVVYTIWQLITGNLSVKESIVGPIGIAKITGEAAVAGFFPFISLLAMISIFLGVFNLFPMPPLDGGRILFVLIEAVLKRQLNPKIERLIIAAGWALLLTLMVVVTKNDLMRLMGK